MGDPTTIGLSAEAHGYLKDLKEDGPFNEMIDAYLFAISLALSMGGIAEEMKKRQTIFNIGTLDKEGKIRSLVELLKPDLCVSESPYRIAERLAEWGVHELWRRYESGSLSMKEILQEIKEGNT